MKCIECVHFQCTHPADPDGRCWLKSCSAGADDPPPTDGCFDRRPSDYPRLYFEWTHLFHLVPEDRKYLIGERRKNGKKESKHG